LKKKKINLRLKFRLNFHFSWKFSSPVEMVDFSGIEFPFNSHHSFFLGFFAYLRHLKVSFLSQGNFFLREEWNSEIWSKLPKLPHDIHHFFFFKFKRFELFWRFASLVEAIFKNWNCYVEIFQGTHPFSKLSCRILLISFQIDELVAFYIHIRSMSSFTLNDLGFYLPIWALRLRIWFHINSLSILYFYSLFLHSQY